MSQSNSIKWNEFTYDTATRSLTIKDRTYSAQEMQEIADRYTGVNRIHKPFPLLFWIDCKNGKSSNWVSS